MFGNYFTGVVIEEITEEVSSTSSANLQSSSTEYSLKKPRESTGFSKSENRKMVGDVMTNTESLQALKDDPEALRFIFIISKFSVRFFVCLVWQCHILSSLIGLRQICKNYF